MGRSLARDTSTARHKQDECWLLLNVERERCGSASRRIAPMHGCLNLDCVRSGLRSSSTSTAALTGKSVEHSDEHQEPDQSGPQRPQFAFQPNPFQLNQGCDDKKHRKDLHDEIPRRSVFDSPPGQAKTRLHSRERCSTGQNCTARSPEARCRKDRWCR
jgi:hypothetical protein